MKSKRRLDRERIAYARTGSIEEAGDDEGRL